MGRPNFSQLVAPLVAQHLHDDVDVVNGEEVEGLQ